MPIVRVPLTFAILFLGNFSMAAEGADWVRAGVNSKYPIWGLQEGLQFAIHPGGFTWGEGGPRGLIRIGYPTLPDGKYDLINFIAIEPTVGKTRGLSELEKSAVDGRPGKIFTAGLSADEPASLHPGTIHSLPDGVEELVVPLQIEKFTNGAHVRLTLSQRSDAPEELKLTVHAEPDSAPMDTCILTATMGNKARARLLWLKDGAVSSLKIFGDYREPHFTRSVFFPLDRLSRNALGDAIASITNDESDPANVQSGIGRGWQYLGRKVTQYWRKPAAELDQSLRCAVNARFTYWASQNPVPGGLAYENFELIENFRDGQSFIFGITPQTPSDLTK